MGKHKSLASAAKDGAQLETLELLRNKIAAAIENTDDARNIAALSLRLMNVMDNIAELKAAEDAKHDQARPLNAIQAKRAARAKAANKD